MNTTSDITPITLLAAYVEGRKDGFKTGIAFSVGIVVVANYVNRRRRNGERRDIFGRK